MIYYVRQSTSMSFLHLITMFKQFGTCSILVRLVSVYMLVLWLQVTPEVVQIPKYKTGEKNIGDKMIY